MYSHELEMNELYNHVPRFINSDAFSERSVENQVQSDHKEAKGDLNGMMDMYSVYAESEYDEKRAKRKQKFIEHLVNKDHCKITVREQGEYCGSSSKGTNRGAVDPKPPQPP